VAVLAGNVGVDRRRHEEREQRADRHAEGDDDANGEARGGASEAVDSWFAAWSEPDAAARQSVLDRIASHDVRFRDQFSLIDGMADLRPHLAAVHKFMPGMRITRDGDVRHCQGTVLADWVARGTDGQERGRGTNVFVFGPTGDIRSVAGFWGPAA